MTVAISVKALFSKCRLLENGHPTVSLNESEIYSLLLLICRDLGWGGQKIGLPLPVSGIPSDDYYAIESQWFLSHETAPHLQTLLEALAKAIVLDADFALYFLNLCSVHKRRLKFQKILSTQPKPTIDQIGTRNLLEHGFCDANLLNSWLVWRKWIFDIDNRSGQETGYLFEPILASCLGGESVGSTNSPVKRIDENGQSKSTGRQIDCYLGDENKAYEFKIRVTIAASGQGRFAEELSFPKECKAAGLKPILVVLDPTPSSRLTELSNCFLQNGGEVFIGEQAWQHLESKAGKIMSLFIEKYVRPPLMAVEKLDSSKLAPLTLIWENDQISIDSGDNSYKIMRQQKGGDTAP